MFYQWLRQRGLCVDFNTILFRVKWSKQALGALFEGIGAKYHFSQGFFRRENTPLNKKLCRLKLFDNHTKEKLYCATDNYFVEIFDLFLLLVVKNPFAV